MEVQRILGAKFATLGVGSSQEKLYQSWGCVRLEEMDREIDTEYIRQYEKFATYI